MGNLSLFAGLLLLFQRIDQIDRREEADPLMGMHDGLYTDGGGHVSLAGTWPADQHHVVGGVHELTAMQMPGERFVGNALREVESGEVAVSREAGNLHRVIDRAELSFCQFGLKSPPTIFQLSF